MGLHVTSRTITFTVVPEDLSALVAKLRATGGDTTSVEVKSASGGLPQSLTQTLSALANQPGGGLIILGLDEMRGFNPVVLADPQALKQGLGAKARTYTPPVQLTIDDGVVDGAGVVIARVRECDLSAKPCRVTSTGKGYIRGYDGDYELSALEDQAFVAQRTAPRYDQATVPGGVFEDLDPVLLQGWLATARERDVQGLGRFSDDRELLRRAGVTDRNGQPTVAGLLALGLHPQQWYPRFTIQLASTSSRPSESDVRAANVATLTGPIPEMLDAAISWARQTFAVSVVGDGRGNVRDRHDYPIDAFRELIANALVHRDLADWSIGLAIEVRHQPDRLVIANPGGLYGITVERLGQEAVTSARNPRLLSICQYVRSKGEGGRVIEALATGIPIVNSALNEAGLPPAQYIDGGIRFTVVLRREPPRPGPRVRGATANRVLTELLAGARSVADLERELDLTGPNVRRVLRMLRDRGLVESAGRVGGSTVYRRREEG